MSIFLGIPKLSIYYPELVKDWECWDTSGEILHHTPLIPFTQIIFVLSWIIVTPCGIAAQSSLAVVSCSTSLERLQRRAAKTVFKMVVRDKALEHLKWPSLVTRRESHVNKLVKRCIKGQCPRFFKNYFTLINRSVSSVHGQTTRQMNKLHLPRVRTDIAKDLFYCNGCNISSVYLFFSSLAE